IQFMRIDFTWPDHLIPMVAQMGEDQYIVDLFINSMLLENDEDTPRRLTRVILDLMHTDNPLWRMEIPLPALIPHLAVDAHIGSFSEESKRNMVGDYLAQRITNVHADATFQPGVQGLIRRFPIRFIASSAPDTLIARAFSGSHLIGRSEIAIRPFKNRYAYHFPVTGVWQVIRNFDYTLGHRAYAGQEFAIDLVRLGDNGLLRRNTKDSPDDFLCFGAPVQAMADGEIIRIEHAIEDNRVGCQSDQKEFERRIKKYSYLSARAGNHVIIRHEDDRYSFYAHLRKDSIPLTTGSTVKKGDEIGAVGNSGQCTFSHLHIQLNEGPNPLGSRGLPMTFSDLSDITGNALPMIT
ncbi:MAG TPA: M23 family metallopeptidase, partial [bacterium]|nr:M23 family metallopeptidase [bacterium]